MECHEDLYKLNCPLICKKKKKNRLTDHNIFFLTREQSFQ